MWQAPGKDLLPELAGTADAKPTGTANVKLAGTANAAPAGIANTKLADKIFTWRYPYKEFPLPK